MSLWKAGEYCIPERCGSYVITVFGENVGIMKRGFALGSLQEFSGLVLNICMSFFDHFRTTFFFKCSWYFIQQQTVLRVETHRSN